MPLKITHSNRIFRDAFFYMKKEYMDYFYDMGWTCYKSKSFRVFLFTVYFVSLFMFGIILLLFGLILLLLFALI